jgi:hypothetical protein
MRRVTWMASLAALLLASGLAAQETAKDASTNEPGQAAHRKIRVLASPYDLASFYRSSGRSRYGLFGDDRDGRLKGIERYPIAGYYRSGNRESFAYWHEQTWRRAPLPMTRTKRRTSAARRGELYLFVPALLVPVMPLAEERTERAADPALR